MRYPIKSEAEKRIVQVLRAKIVGSTRSVSKSDLLELTRLNEEEFTFALRELMRARYIFEGTGGRIAFSTTGLLVAYN